MLMSWFARCRKGLLARWPLIQAVVLVQLAFWLVVYPLLFDLGPLPRVLPIREPAVATLASPDLAALAKARFEPIELPHSGCCGPGYRAFRFLLDLDAVPERGLAFAPSLGADNLLLYVNGQLVIGEGRMELPDITYHGHRRRVETIPPGALVVGANRFEAILVRDTAPWFDYRRPLIGENEEVRERTATREYFVNTYRMQATAVGIVEFLLLLLLVWRSSHRRFAVAAAVLVAAQIHLGWHGFWMDPPYDGRVRLLLYFLASLTAPIAWLNVANEWTERPWPWVVALSLLGWAIGAAALAWWMLSGVEGGYDAAGAWVDRSAMLFGAAAVLRLLWHTAVVHEARVYELALFLLLITLMLGQFLSEMLWAQSQAYLTSTQPILLLAFVAAFVARNIRLFASKDEINALLTSQLQERERELAQRHARESSLMAREALLNERQRLMGEIHDGIGGQIVALMHASRHAPMPGPELATALQAVLDELRFVVHSLDNASSTVGSALGMFRRRLEPRLAAAGIRLRWMNRLPEDDSGFGPVAVLQICRVLQEAVSNALQHARTAAIDIEVERLTSATGDRLVLRVRDHGLGMPADAAGGHGLASMRRRAGQLEGTLTWTSSEPGTTVTLDVPWPKDAAVPAPAPHAA